MTSGKEHKTQTVHLGQDGLLPFLQNLYLGAGVEGAAKAAGRRVTTAGAEEVPAKLDALDDNANYTIPGAILRQMLEYTTAGQELAGKTTEALEKLSARLEQERQSYKLLMDDYVNLIESPEAYEAARGEWLSEAVGGSET